jgi:hypothetical protein
MKNQVPNDIPVHGQFIENTKLKSQEYLNQINKWTEDHKMVINQKKTKAMVFNYTDNYKFTTRLQLKGENIEIVNKMKILGTIVNDKLCWDDNCQYIIKKVNARMQLIRNLQSFGATHSEMVHLWTIFCRSVLEQSCAVWHSSLTQENIDDLERTQKSFCKIVLRENYTTYENALYKLDMDSLHDRRNILQLKFAKSGIKHDKLNDLLPKTENICKMERRNIENFKVNFANTERLKKSSIISMQKQLNTDCNQNKRRKWG